MVVIDYSENPIVGVKGRKQNILKKDLFVDHSYQRDRSLTTELRSYAQNFSWSKFGEIVVADYGKDNPKERYAIVDGQGRWMISLLRQEIGYIPCLIYDLTPESAAELYYYLNTARKTPTSVEKYKAALVFRDPTAIEINRILLIYGITVDRSDIPKTLDSISTCTRYVKISKESFEATINILSEVCQNHRITQYLLKGTFYFIRNIDGIENPEVVDKLKNRMCRVGAEKLNVATFQASTRLLKGDKAIAECMLDVINYKLTEGSRFYLRPPKPTK